MIKHDHSDVQSLWDAQAVSYSQKADRMEPGLRAVTGALLDAVGLAPGMRLLDLGCGSGHTTAEAHGRGAEVLGLDQSPAMVSEARVRFPAVRFMVGDMMKPPQGPWDAITCRFAAHHAGPAWLSASWRVLRPSGRIAIAELGPEPPDQTGKQSGKVGPAEWCRRFDETGFVDVAVVPLRVQLPPAVIEQDRHGHHWPPTWIISGRKPSEIADASGRVEK
jgi:ubiquinone/menaquinone biosynthesis C-methylase UbiE